MQTSSASAVPDVPCKQSSFRTPPSLSYSPSNTPPTVQVEETPYRKGSSGIRNSQPPSPTVSRTPAILGYFHGESDDITLIPGTNTEELGNSSSSPHALATRLSTPDQGSSPPEMQVTSLDYIPSSAETRNDLSSLDDSAMFQRQLRREIQQRTDVEVPATAETDDARVQYTGSQQPLSLELSRKRKQKRLIKSVDFQSQEIRTANTHNISSMLENQKRQFLGLEDGHSFEGLDSQGDRPLSMNERLGINPEIKIPTSLVNISGIHGSSAPVRHVGVHVLISSDDEDVIPNISPSNTRKRHQPTPSNAPKSAKKPRAGGESTCGISHTQPPASASIHAAQNTAKSLAGPRNELSRTTSESVDEDKGEIEPEVDNDDLMAGFPPVESSIDNAPEPPWPSQIPSKPEIYAGIRERHLSVPGYGNLTDDQKKELDKRRQEYFGITPREGTNRLFSVKLQRAMQSASSSSPLRKQAKRTGGGGKAVKTVGDEWYRDENTPLKIFYRNFKELKQVKAELETGTDGSGV